MTRNEYSYQILTIIRGGYVADDERIDLRILHDLIKQYRREYIEVTSKHSQKVLESLRQHTSFNLALVNHGVYNRLETEDQIPIISTNRFGPMIKEIYSSYVDEFPYTIVNRTALRYSGNGRFNENIIFVAYDNNKLYFKSKNAAYNNLDKISITAIFSEPEDVPGFDVDTDEYPMDLECFNYCKEMILKGDLKLLLTQVSDEINNADGEIEK